MKDIRLRLTGKQLYYDRPEENEQIEFITEGRICRKESGTYIIYDETDALGAEKIRTSLRIGDDGTVRMKRFGKGVIMDTTMEFRPGQHHTSLYPTPYGAFDMEILTNRVVSTIQPDTLTGNLLIDYEISLKGLTDAHNLLNIELYEPPVEPARDSNFPEEPTN